MVKNSKLKRFVAIGLPLIFLTFFVAFADRVLAVEYGGFGGRPAYPREDNPRTESIFVHTLELGDVQDEGVKLVNNTAVIKTILVYAVDSTPSTGGAFACAQKSAPKIGVGTWTELEKSEVTLNPGENEIVPFTITIPQNASVGEHNGCIVMQEKKPPSKEGSGASLSFRTGLRIAITIPGALIRKIDIVDFTSESVEGGRILRPKVKNTGNVSIDADVKIYTKNTFGFLYKEHGGGYPILRGETSDWNFELAKPFWGGFYKSQLIVEYDENPEAGVGQESGKEMTKLKGPTIWFWSFPELGALAIELVVLLTIGFGVFLVFVSRKRKDWIKKSWHGYEIQEGENINSLAEKFDISWKLLAKANKLQPPYALKTKTIIKVPPIEKKGE